MGEARLGTDYSKTFDDGFNPAVTVKLGASAVTNFAMTSTGVSAVFPMSEWDWRGRIDFGVSTKRPSGWTLSSSMFVDGIGMANYRSIGGTIRFEKSF